MASFEKLNYALRPSKQIERKLLIETFQRMSKSGYYLQDYAYLGMGSVYYTDFILFHKYLLIDEMICAEYSTSHEGRMEFNRPFEFIKLFMEPVGNFFPQLDRNKRYLVWLDYDSSLDEDKLNDIRGCIHVLTPGSILLITITADPKLLNNYIDDQEELELTGQQRKNRIVAMFNDIMARHIGREIQQTDLSVKNLPTLYAIALRNFIKLCVDTRSPLQFHQLFNFRYADNLQMLTLGGVIDEPDATKRLQESHISDLGFIRTGIEPLLILVPHLTVREKIWLEKYFVNVPNPPQMKFEIQKKLIENFEKYYRHYPTYYETLT